VRLVVKVGTSSLVGPDGLPEPAAIWQLCMQIRHLTSLGHQVVLVSSGAVATGTALVGHAGLSRQALAAVGQAHLIGLYREFLGVRTVAQLLVLKPDLEPPGTELRQTLLDLLNARVLPVVNENDVVSRTETAVGENDTVAAALACLVQADLLVLLSDVDGVYDEPPGAFLPHLDLDEARRWLSGGSRRLTAGSRWGRGGMQTKLEAAVRAGEAGIPTVIARARRARVLQDLVDGMPVGTRVEPCAAVNTVSANGAWKEESHGG
jgi:glutamate 5-kinase